MEYWGEGGWVWSIGVGEVGMEYWGEGGWVWSIGVREGGYGGAY